MQSLTATFEVTFPEPPLIRVPPEVCEDPAVFRVDPDDSRFSLRLDEFSVDVELVVGGGGAAVRQQSETSYVTPAAGARVFVTRNEANPIPAIDRTPRGGRDRTRLTKFLSGLKPGYVQAAREALDRLMRHFRFELGNPLVSGRELAHTDFVNPIWTDADGSLVSSRRNVYVVPSTLGLRLYPSWSVDGLNIEQMNKLETLLSNPVTVPLYREMLAEAKDAAALRNVRRAVLELAVCCEIATKQAFFAKDSPSAEAFEYLEEKGRVRVPVKDLLHEPAKRAFGASFKESEPDAWKEIDLLFRCRNKVAHRAKAEYRDRTDSLQAANEKTLLGWWNSVVKLLEWLESNTPLKGNP